MNHIFHLCSENNIIYGVYNLLGKCPMQEKIILNGSDYKMMLFRYLFLLENQEVLSKIAWNEMTLLMF